MASSIHNTVNIIRTLRITRYTRAASASIHLYDIALTLDLEIQYIWTRLSFNLHTVLYIVNRYICLAFFLFATYKTTDFHGKFSDAFCRLPLDSIGFMLGNVANAVILTLRVRALWLQRRVVIWSIYVFFVAAMSTFLITANLSNAEIRTTMHYFPPANRCMSIGIPRLMKGIPIGPTVYTLFLTVLTLVKALDIMKWRDRTSLPFFYQVLMQDGVAHFVISSGILTLNLIYWNTASGARIAPFLGIPTALLSSVTARLVLNLKASLDHEQRETNRVSANLTGLFTRVHRQDFGTEGGVAPEADVGSKLGSLTLPSLSASSGNYNTWDSKRLHSEEAGLLIPLRRMSSEPRANREG